jgi:hypothetical protein
VNLWKSRIAGWRAFPHRFSLRCATCHRISYRWPWEAVLRPRRGVRMAGVWYCRPECLQPALTELLTTAQAAPPRKLSPHRVPLGLILLSRQHLTVEQLRAALDAQHCAGSGRIGEWIETLGFASEPQITAALAKQWSCPVLRCPIDSGADIPAIPFSLLESFQMIPVDFGEATGRLLIAFSERVDHSALYAIERMLGYRTEACFATSSTLREALFALGKHRRAASDVVFERMEDTGLCAHIITSYVEKTAAEEVRVALCHGHIWARLEKARRETVNLILHTPAARTRTSLASMAPGTYLT